jgi:hypothetical protein
MPWWGITLDALVSTVAYTQSHFAFLSVHACILFFKTACTINVLCRSECNENRDYSK